MVALDWVGTYGGDPDYEFDRLAIEIGEQIVAHMERQEVSQSDLARRLGVSRARISQILRGSDNLTLKSIVAVAVGLDCRVGFRLYGSRTAANGAARVSAQDWRILARGGAGSAPVAAHADRARPRFASAA